jgi:hypothetical protein
LGSSVFSWPNPDVPPERPPGASGEKVLPWFFFNLELGKDVFMNALKWKELLSRLKSGTAVPGTRGDTDWTRHVCEISVPGQIVSLTEDDWNYWLEVLPPRWMSGSHFCFAEGEEPFRLFWTTKEGQFFVRQLDAEETLRFCELAGIRAPTIEVTPTLGDDQEQVIKRYLHPPLGECCGEGGI